MIGGIAMTTMKISDVPQNFMDMFVSIFRGKKELTAYPKNENLILVPENEYNQLIKKTSEIDLAIRASILDDIKDIQEAVINSGAEEMSMEEINAEIQSYRREKRGL